MIYFSNYRPELEPPLLQQAAFDDLIYEVDVMRNVAVRLTQEEKELSDALRERSRRPSLPVGAVWLILTKCCRMFVSALKYCNDGSNNF